MSSISPSKTKIHLIRHGEVSNPTKILYARLPRFKLSKKGVNQAKQLAEYFKETPIHGIYHSPLLRAKQTARYLIANNPDAIVKKSTLLDEVLTPYEGEKLSTLEDMNWDMYSDLKQGYESPQEIVKRFQHFTQRVLRDHLNKEVIGVTHGDVVVFATLWGRSLDLTHENRMSLDPYPEHCSITTLTFSGNGAEPPSVEYNNPVS